MDISEIAPGLYVASRFYALSPSELPRHSVVIDCAASLSDDAEPQDGAIETLAQAVSLLWPGTWHTETFNDVEFMVVLVCDAGRNRSAVVAARALMLSGYRAEEAISIVRTARQVGGNPDYALTNQAFVDYLNRV